MVEKLFCKRCNQEVLPLGKGENICPICKKFITMPKSLREGLRPQKEKTPIESRKPEPEPEQPREYKYEVRFGASTNLSSKEWQVIEELVNSGAAKDAADVLRKGIHALASYHRMGGENMENPKKEETLGEIENMEDKELRRRYIEAKIKEREAKIPKDEKKEKEPESEEEGFGFDMKKMMKDAQKQAMQMMAYKMQMDLMQQFMGGTMTKKEESEAKKLSEDLAKLREEIKEDKKIDQWESQFKSLADRIDRLSDKGDKGETIKSYLELSEKNKAEIEKLRLTHEEKIEKERQETKEAEKEALAEKLGRWEDRLVQISSGKKGMGPEEFKEFAETLKAAKTILGPEVTGAKPEESGLDKVAKIADSVGKIMSPMIEAKAQQIANPQPQVITVEEIAHMPPAQKEATIAKLPPEDQEFLRKTYFPKTEPIKTEISPETPNPPEQPKIQSESKEEKPKYKKTKLVPNPEDFK